MRGNLRSYGARSPCRLAPMQTLGIDLSTDPKKVWTCEIDWDESPPRVVALDCLGEAPDPREPPQDVPWRSQGLVRDEAGLIAALIERITAFGPAAGRIVGIDAPFGWPDAFVEAMTDWAAGDLSGFTKRPELRLRATDRFVHAAVGVTPMSVSTDRIGSTAMLCAEVLSGAARGLDRPAFDRARASDGLAEVYPAAALKMWTTDDGSPLATAGYKSANATRSSPGGLLSQLIGFVDAYELRETRPSRYDPHPRYDGPMSFQHPSLGAAGVVVGERHRDQMRLCDDALDAFVCSLVARAIAVNRCFTVDRPADPGEVLPPVPRTKPEEAPHRAFLRAQRAQELQSEAVESATREGWIHVPVFGTVRGGVGLGAAPAPESFDEGWHREVFFATTEQARLGGEQSAYGDL